MDQIERVCGQVIKGVLGENVVKATKYLSEKLVVKATRRRFHGKILKKARITEINVTIGAPNYAEREFIKKARKAGEPFPIKKIQLKKIKG
ncbi:MAG: hypothetical protein PHI99_10970 [Syntrophales bacterium]|nr:hypothetical protein [Syntrophales bacterium]